MSIDEVGKKLFQISAIGLLTSGDIMFWCLARQAAQEFPHGGWIGYIGAALLTMLLAAIGIEVILIP